MQQLPLPDHISTDRVIQAIHPDKDVDGFHPTNVGRLSLGQPGLVPCTPMGVMALLHDSGFTLKGKRAVVVGRSDIVGKPMVQLLLKEHATVTVMHSRTQNPPAVCREADLVVAAVGVPGLVSGDWLKEGAFVIDVGINRVDDPSTEKGYKLVGDVDFPAALEKASLITPVPGGVGPMTITMLLYNTVASAKMAAGIE